MKIESEKAPKPVGAYPHARKVGNLLFLSGVGPRKPNSKKIPGVVTDKIGLYRIESKCNRCNDTQEKIIERTKVIQTKTKLENSPCLSCKSSDIEVTDQDIVDYLSLLGAKTGTKIEVISSVSEHGSMVSNLGNIGAILRYNRNYSK